MKKAIPLLLALLLSAGCAREAASAPEVAFVPSVTIRRMDVLAEASLNQTDRITVVHALEEQGYSNAQAEIVAHAQYKQSRASKRRADRHRPLCAPAKTRERSAIHHRLYR